MKLFKRIDLSIQVLLILATIGASLILRSDILIPGLSIVVVWQLVSMTVHFINKWHPLKGGRRYTFQLIVVTLLLPFCLAAFVPGLYPLGWFVVFAVPLAQVMYVWICFMEVFYYSKRPLDLI